MATAEKLWRFQTPDDALVESVRQDNDVPQAVALALVNRGLVDPEEIQFYLHPRLRGLSDPFLFPDMEKAAGRIWEAIDAGERILVYGDYDVDGVTSTALMVQVLAGLGAESCAFIPHRVRDGYGLTVATVEHCLTTHKPKLIVTVDCGTGSVDAVRAAQERGVDVIVTDHHEPSEGVADAYALVNPKQGNCPEHLKTMAGVGVAFKLCHALLKVGRSTKRSIAAEFDLRPYTSFAAMGTIADVVPLRGENRALVHSGLRMLNCHPSTGMRALVDSAGIRGALNGHHIGFQIGPRINAAGRMAEPDTALNLLLEDEYPNALKLADKLNCANRERQQIEMDIFEEAREQIEDSFNPDTDYAIVVAGEGWHPGVVGIVASRLVGKFYRPAVVIGLNDDGSGKGSCRSIEGFNLVEGLTRSSEHLVKYGGHQMAAGLELKPDCLDAFRVSFNAAAKEVLEHEPLKPSQMVDGWLQPHQVNLGLYQYLQMMSPFGSANPRPVWGCKDLRVCKPPRVVGERHLKLIVDIGSQEVEAFGYNMGARTVSEDDVLNLVFHVQCNTYFGYDSLQLNLIDFESV